MSLGFEKETTESSNYEDSIDEFASVKARKIKMWSIRFNEFNLEVAIYLLNEGRGKRNADENGGREGFDRIGQLYRGTTFLLGALFQVLPRAR